MYGCSGCKVNLCSWACFKAWDHINHCASRELVVQYARVQPESVVGPATQQVEGRIATASASPATGGGEPRRRSRSAGPEEPLLEEMLKVGAARGRKGGRPKGS